ncbi:MAG: radical SAM protein [archaeon]
MKFDDSILAVEMTNHCNLRCPMCTQSVTSVPRGYMDFETWKKALDTARMHQAFLPFALGESLLHPEFEKMLSYALEKNRQNRFFHYMTLHTNALLLDEDKTRVILEHADQIGTIHFSLDAASQGVYKKIRVGGLLKTAEANVMNFLKARSELSLEHPHGIIQFIVMKDNQREAEAFLDRWSVCLSSLGQGYQVNYDWSPPMVNDTIFFKRENTWNPNDLKKAEALHKAVALRLGLIKETEGRILDSDEFVE